MNTKIRTYEGLSKLQTFLERFNYLKLSGRVGETTFGFDRYLNQLLYTSSKWRRVRDLVLIRDNGCDLGIDGYTIYDSPIIHHMNPVSIKDIEANNPDVFNIDFLICVSKRTHNAIHYSDEKLLPKGLIVRAPNDTCPWKGGVKNE